MNAIETLRADTPGCQHVIHFNNAGAGLMPGVVYDRHVQHLALERDIGGYESKEKHEAELAQVYVSAAKLINAKPNEIALMENATVAWIAAFTAIEFQPGDRILTAISSYDSNYLNFLRAKERFGVEIDVIPNDTDGQVDVAALKNMLDDRVKLVAITHVPTNGGTVNPAVEIGAVLANSKALYLLDACQSIGQLPVDVVEIGCDVLSTTGRKWLRGPRGTGFLYVKEEQLERLKPAVIDLHSALWQTPTSYTLDPTAKRFENWESNFAGYLALGTAIEYAIAQDPAQTWARVQSLSAAWRARLSAIETVTVQDIGKLQGGIVTFSSTKMDADSIKMALRARQMNVSMIGVGSTLLDSGPRQLPALVRASVHYYNTEAEQDQVAAAIRDVLGV